jgi:uncharacterized membrane protein
VLLILMAMYQRTKTLEMQHRERLAMIERGIAPAPARDPAEFERWQQFDARPRHSPATTLGVVTVALGLGLMLIISFAARAADVGVGIGAVAVVGIAFIVNGSLQRRTPPPAPPFRPHDPRGPVGP